MSCKSIQIKNPYCENFRLQAYILNNTLFHHQKKNKTLFSVRVLLFQFSVCNLN